jgi:hypothetical protein
MVSFKGNENELNANWDRTVDHSLFGTWRKKIYFVAPINESKQLFG